ncbi:hypothetical protein EDB85DRAFT_1894451 [Lactarius pseudohatsudake]|nr:hypothetical protein EDB85DRAFT_1894451 [Lactarius pseudohatsudake]
MSALPCHRQWGPATTCTPCHAGDGIVVGLAHHGGMASGWVLRHGGIGVGVGLSHSGVVVKENSRVAKDRGGSHRLTWQGGGSDNRGDVGENDGDDGEYRGLVGKYPGNDESSRNLTGVDKKGDNAHTSITKTKVSKKEKRKEKLAKPLPEMKGRGRAEMESGEKARRPHIQIRGPTTQRGSAAAKLADIAKTTNLRCKV